MLTSLQWLFGCYRDSRNLTSSKFKRSLERHLRTSLIQYISFTKLVWPHGWVWSLTMMHRTYLPCNESFYTVDAQSDKALRFALRFGYMTVTTEQDQRTQPSRGCFLKGYKAVHWRWQNMVRWDFSMGKHVSAEKFKLGKWKEGNRNAPEDHIMLAQH